MDKAIAPPGDVRPPAPQPLPAAEIVVGITIVDGDCTEDCIATLTVHCTTTTDHTSVDWMLVPRVEFNALRRELGCE